YWQWVQTLMFSSSSLSNTMVLHLGHLVHKPSGISRLRDLEASLGFLAKVVLFVAGGGVTPGSAVSRPSVRFVNEVVLILPVSSGVGQECGVGARSFEPSE